MRLCSFSMGINLISFNLQLEICSWMMDKVCSSSVNVKTLNFVVFFCCFFLNYFFGISDYMN